LRLGNNLIVLYRFNPQDLTPRRRIDRIATTISGSVVVALQDDPAAQPWLTVPDPDVDGLTDVVTHLQRLTNVIDATLSPVDPDVNLDRQWGYEDID
jgi:hypothetical protein